MIAMALKKKTTATKPAPTRRRTVRKPTTKVEPSAVDTAPGFEADTPSARALAAVGNLDGETVGPDGYEAANAHGEKYLAEKRKHRWGI